jgi:uncharacterized cysteine cluster protein YcgN (CxxCxxCC family)
VKKSAEPFWTHTPIEEMTPSQWESLCDGCARCCLQKLQDHKTGKIYYTRVACRLLDVEKCRCLSYPNRNDLVPNCAVLTPENVRRYGWLPPTCAYRLLAQGAPLNAWHPLVSNDPNSVQEAGISVRGQIISENHVHPDDFQYLIFEFDE